MDTNKNKVIVVGVVLIIIIGAMFFLNQDSTYKKESLMIEQGLISVELTKEEEQALQDEGLQMPSEEDALAEELLSVRSSDEIDAIDADINETNLSGLDAELEEIDSDLLGF